MTARARIIAIVATVWVAAVGLATVALYASRETRRHMPPMPDNGTYEQVRDAAIGTTPYRVFNWETWSAWTAAITLAAVVAIAIALIAVSRPRGAS